MIYDTSPWFRWDPSPVLFTIPGIEWPIAWYGALFATGFFVGFWLIQKIFEEALGSSEDALHISERLLWWVVLSTVLGARLGHVLFYGLPGWETDPLALFKTWQGGLASHGAAIGIMLAMYLFQRSYRSAYPQIHFFLVSDALVIPAAFAGACIRMGNFFNQEMVGTVTELPWAIVFGHPFNGVAPLPRHPAQLYEALFYLATFAFLYFSWKQKRWKLGSGAYSALFLILVFTFRFCVEFVKLPQSEWLPENSPLLMGQILSLPFIALGCFLYQRSKKF